MTACDTGDVMWTKCFEGYEIISFYIIPSPHRYQMDQTADDTEGHVLKVGTCCV